MDFFLKKNPLFIESIFSMSLNTQLYMQLFFLTKIGNVKKKRTIGNPPFQQSAFIF